MLGAVSALQSLGVHVPSYQTKPSVSNGFSNIFRHFTVRAEEAEQTQSKSDRPEKVLVGGGTGFVGKEVCVQLRKSGYEVIIVSRSPGQFRLTWEDVEKGGLPSGTKAVINLSGQNVLDPFSRWSPAFKELCRSSRLEATSALASAIRRAPKDCKPRVFVSVSGVGYYAPDGVTEYDEAGGQGSDWLAELSGQWENATADCGNDVRRVIIRPGVVLGRNGGLISQIYLPFFLGLGGRMGTGNQPLPWIHVKDLAGLIKHAVENEKMEGVYNGVAPQIITNQQFVDSFAAALGRPSFIPLPEFVWNLVFGEERAVMITKGQKVQPRRTLESGYRFRFPTIQQACAEFSRLLYGDEDLQTN